MNSVNFEAFGHGLFYSLSYERILINDFEFKLAGQLGASVYPYPDQIDVWMPISLNYLKTIGKNRRNHIETGIGHVARYDQFYREPRSHYPWQTFITAKAGYRYQKPEGRWIYKILFTPFYEYDVRTIGAFKTFSASFLYPSGALSVGRVL